MVKRPSAYVSATHDVGLEMEQSSGEAFEDEVANFLSFTGAQPLLPNSIFVLVMGITGSGKSTFIARCTRKSVRVGHDLLSCTSDLAIFKFEHYGYNVYLIDTPGFDDTNVADIDTLKTIAHYLSVSYANRVHLGGIIYLHRISDNRVSGTSKRNMDMFKALVGVQSYANVVLATTHWNEDEREDCLRRERQLVASESFFRDLCDRGAVLFRHAEHGRGAAEETASALEIVTHLIPGGQRQPPMPLQIQREMVDEMKSLDETKAAQILIGELYRAKMEFREHLERVQNEINAVARAGDREAERRLREAKDEFRVQLEQADLARSSMHTSLIEMHKKEEQRVLEILRVMEKRWEDTLTAKENELEVMEESLRHLKEQAERSRHGKEELKPQEQNRLGNDQQFELAAQQELAATRRELEDLRRDIAKKKGAGGKIRAALASGMASGVASAVIAAGVAAIGAGMLCIVC